MEELKKEEPKKEEQNLETSSQNEKQEQAQIESQGESQDTQDTSSINVAVYKDYISGLSLNKIHKTRNIPKNNVWDMVVAGAEELGEEPPKKRRGRKPTPADVLPTKEGKARKVGSVLTKESVIKQIQGLHQVLALMTVPEAAISESEAQLLGEAVYEVIKDSELEWLSKYEKYINLAVAVTVVEVPTALRIKEAMDKKKKKPAVVKNEKKNEKEENPFENLIAKGEPMQ